MAELTLSIKPDTLTLSRDHRRIVAFDREGRWTTLFLDGVVYQRGLSGQVVEKAVTEEDGASRKRLRALSPGERARLAGVTAELAGEAQRQLEHGDGQLRWELPPRVAHLLREAALPPEELARPWLERALAWDERRLEEDVRRFLEVYQPVSILPPDQYRAVYLQATTGCSYNKCAFCDLYRDRPFAAKTVDEFRRHVAAVRRFLGGTALGRRTLFLGDGNALMAPTDRLLHWMAEASSVFPLAPGATAAERIRYVESHPGTYEGFYVFQDLFHTREKSVAELEALAAAGLRRVYLGVETGSEALSRFLHKPGRPSYALQAVRNLHRAGLAVGLILLLGAGGEAYAEEHVSATAELINQMELGPEDLIYYSPIVEIPGLPYQRAMDAQSIRRLDEAELEEQRRRLDEAIRAPRWPRGPRRSLYDLREFVY
ncbi:MAG: radical SAM protein [Clostridia bacterium]|nr:radical SAM protein [Clostridia bacterium]MCL6521198.1 radical SAM protein [Bacillota bacterium]